MELAYLNRWLHEAFTVI